MKAVIFGIGKMGTAIAYAMKRLGHEIVGVDSNPNGRANLNKNLRENDYAFYHSNNLEADKAEILDYEKPHVVISSMPYHQNLSLAKYCINSGLRYCDLGGSVPVSKEINSFAEEKATKPVMTDLGLAPGWVNILAEQGYKELHGSSEDASIKMMVGGLPDYHESNENPLRYATTWSIDGLINEYKDDCVILENGEIKTVKGMDGLESIDTEKLGKLEAFYTSGGASHSIYSMKTRGVKNCSYKTLRYKGHRDIVKFLIRDCQLNDEALNKVFSIGCGTASKDEVIILAKVFKGDKVWQKEKLISSDEQFSAMQKATAFPISAVASMMAEGLLEGDMDQRRDYYIQYPKVLAYENINTEVFNIKINLLGLGQEK
jgi:saccharopine dehydrogenase-like NADP-dependent oxidoreductase